MFAKAMARRLTARLAAEITGLVLHPGDESLSIRWVYWARTLAVFRFCSCVPWARVQMDVLVNITGC
jgi:hypothetical protein